MYRRKRRFYLFWNEWFTLVRGKFSSFRLLHVCRHEKANCNEENSPRVCRSSGGHDSNRQLPRTLWMCVPILRKPNLLTILIATLSFTLYIELIKVPPLNLHFNCSLVEIRIWKINRDLNYLT